MSSSSGAAGGTGMLQDRLAAVNQRQQALRQQQQMSQGQQQMLQRQQQLQQQQQQPQAGNSYAGNTGPTPLLDPNRITVPARPVTAAGVGVGASPAGTQPPASQPPAPAMPTKRLRVRSRFMDRGHEYVAALGLVIVLVAFAAAFIQLLVQDNDTSWYVPASSQDDVTATVPTTTTTPTTTPTVATTPTTSTTNTTTP